MTLMTALPGAVSRVCHAQPACAHAVCHLCPGRACSMEFLMGRSLLNTLYNLDVAGQYTEALRELGYDLENLAEKVSGGTAA